MHHPENLSSETEEFFVPHVELTGQHSILEQIKIVGRALYFLKAKRNLSALLDEYPADLAHLHDICHHISPSILHELKKRKIPVVMTLHSLQVICASYHMFAGGKVCEICRNGKYYKAVWRRCVKDSFAKSLLATLEMYLHHRFLDIYNNVDIFIAPSLFLKKKLEEAGYDKKIFHLPNFIDSPGKLLFDAGKSAKGGHENTISYIGRLSLEKGLITLLEAAKLLRDKGMGIKINIIGDGPLMKELKEKVSLEQINNVEFLGYMKHEDLYEEIRKSLAVVLPSECYENNPLAVIEAFALGKPVIGSRLGGIPELVKDHERGVTFEPGNPEDLAVKIEFIVNNPDETEMMGERARFFVEKELNAEKHYLGLMEIYKQAFKNSKSEGRIQ